MKQYSARSITKVLLKLSKNINEENATGYTHTNNLNILEAKAG